jgi:hypothetical protein
VLYFAFGSNLLSEQMKGRCPSSRKVANAALHEYRLTFRGYSGGWGGATATIVPDKGATVPGVVYEIRLEDDVRRLDSFEGCPIIHDCREFVVRLSNGKKVRAWAYVRRDGKIGSPSLRYSQTIAEGLRQHGYGTKNLSKAIEATLTIESKRTGREITWPPKQSPPKIATQPVITMAAGSGIPLKPKGDPILPDGYTLPENMGLEWVLDGDKWVERVVVNRRRAPQPQRVFTPRAETPGKKETRPRWEGSGWDEDDVRNQW